MSEREGIIFFRSWREAIKELPEEKRLDAFEAIIDYALYGAEPETGGIVHAIFLMAKPTIDRNEKAYQDGKRGGRPPGSKKNHGFEKQETMVSGKQKPSFSNSDSTGKENVTEREKEEPDDPLDHASLSDPVREALREWIDYKRERRETYKEKGLRALITQAEKAEALHGPDAVVNLIGDCMSSGYRGIIWDRLRERVSSGNSAASKKNQFTDMEMRQNYDFDAIERDSLDCG